MLAGTGRRPARPATTVVVADGPAPGGAVGVGRLPGAGPPTTPRAEVDRRRAPRSAPTTRPTSSSPRAPPGVPKGVVQTHGRTLCVATDWVAMTGLTAGRPLPDGQPVLPHVRAEGRHPGLASPPGRRCSPSRCSTSTGCSPGSPPSGSPCCPGAPTLYQSILDHPDRDRHDLSSLRVAVTGAADIPVELIRRIDDELPFSVDHHRLRAHRGRHRQRPPRPTTTPRPSPPPSAGPGPASSSASSTTSDGDVAGRRAGRDPAARAAASCRTTSTTRRPPPQALSPDGWLRTGDLGVRRRARAACASSAGPRTCSSSAASTPTRPRSRTRLLAPPRHPAGGGDRHPRRAARRGRHGLRRRSRRAPTSTGADDHRVEPRRRWPTTRSPRAVEIVDELPLNATGKVEKDELRARAAERVRVVGVTATEPHGLSSLADLRVVELGVWVAAPAAGGAARRLGRRRHQGRAAHRRPDAPRLRVARHRRRHAQPGVRPRQPGQAQRRARPPRRRRPRAHGGPAGLGRRVRQQPPPRRPRQARPRAGATVARHPHLVYCSVSGYGLQGEDRNRPTYDIGAFWARSGLSCRWPTATATRSTPAAASATTSPAWPRSPGILAAVLEQRHTGQGRVVEVSLLRTGAYVLGWDLGLQMALGKVAGAEPRHRNQAPLMNPYRAARRPLVLLHRARGRPPPPRGAAGPSAGPTCSTTRASPTPRRSASNRTEVIALLDEIVAERTARRVGRALRRARACGGRRPRPRPRSSRTRSSLANDGFVELDGGDGPALGQRPGHASPASAARHGRARARPRRAHRRGPRRARRPHRRYCRCSSRRPSRLSRGPSPIDGGPRGRHGTPRPGR